MAQSAHDLSLDRTIATRLYLGEALVLATLVQCQGTCARKAGTRALIGSHGLEGSLGGGLFELKLAEAGASVFASHTHQLFTYTGPDDVGVGKRIVLLEWLSSSIAPLFALADSLAALSVDGAWIVDIPTPNTISRTLLLAKAPEEEHPETDGITVDPNQYATLMARCGGKASFFKEGAHTLYVEPLKTPAILLLCGSDPIAQATARLASQCGFCVDVASDSLEDIREEDFPTVRTRYPVPEFSHLTETCAIGQHHFVLILPHTMDSDFALMRQILATSACYIGILQGTAERAAMFASLRKQGVPEAELAAIHTPAGLLIGAETPSQIAVSLVAELLAAHSGTLMPLKSLPN